MGSVNELQLTPLERVRRQVLKIAKRVKVDVKKDPSVRRFLKLFEILRNKDLPEGRLQQIYLTTRSLAVKEEVLKHPNCPLSLQLASLRLPHLGLVAEQVLQERGLSHLVEKHKRRLEAARKKKDLKKRRGGKQR